MRIVEQSKKNVVGYTFEERKHRHFVVKLVIIAVLSSCGSVKIIIDISNIFEGHCVSKA